MAEYDIMNLDPWVTKTQLRIDVCARQSVNNMIRDIEIVPGINRGGSRRRGTIPRDLGALGSSLQSSIYGQGNAGPVTGPTSYTSVLGSFGGGSVAQFSWGGSAAPYAVEVHYGAKGVPGTYWRDVAVDKFPRYFEEAVAEAKRRYP